MSEPGEGAPQSLDDSSRLQHLQPLDQAVNERACSSVLTDIARFPQRVTGVLVADGLMDEFDPNPRSATGIGITEMARIVPDGNYCAPIVNDVHDRFHIDRRVTPDEAAGFVVAFALDGMDHVRSRTLEAAQEMNIDVPDEIRDTEVRKKGPAGSHITVANINKPVAFALHDFLTRSPDLRTIVAAKIKSEADTIRADSRAQQTRAQEKGRMHAAHRDL